MKFKVVAIILLLLLLLLLLLFSFKKISANKIKQQSSNIEQLKILKYLPENNKLLFISNFDSSNFKKIKEDKNPNIKNKDSNIIITIIFIFGFILTFYFYF